MMGILSGVAPRVVGVVVGAVAGSSITYLFSRRQCKVERTPILLFDFSDPPEHENLGAVGFRHIQSKLELLIAGTVRNVGSVLAVGVQLDIYHFQNSNGPPAHEIASIHVADALRTGESLQWSRSIGLADLAVRGVYRSGSTGVFRDDGNFQHYHYHVVFSCKNLQGEPSSSIYLTQKIVENGAFKGNKMVFVRQVGAYRPRAHLPTEWRREIKARELSLRQAMRGGRHR